MFFRDMYNQPFYEIKCRNTFGDSLIVFIRLECCLTNASDYPVFHTYAVTKIRLALPTIRIILDNY